MEREEESELEPEAEKSGLEAARRMRVRTLRVDEGLLLRREHERALVVGERGRVRRGQNRAKCRKVNDMDCPGDCDPECSGWMPRCGRIH